MNSLYVNVSSDPSSHFITTCLEIVFAGLQQVHSVSIPASVKEVWDEQVPRHVVMVMGVVEEQVLEPN